MPVRVLGVCAFSQRRRCHVTFGTPRQYNDLEDLLVDASSHPFPGPDSLLATSWKWRLRFVPNVWINNDSRNIRLYLTVVFHLI